MNGRIYHFTGNDFMQFKDSRKGVLINFHTAFLDNPSLFNADLFLTYDPEFSYAKRGVTSDARIKLRENSRNAAYVLERDHREPRVCPSCTPVPKKIKDGVVLGGMLFKKDLHFLDSEIDVDLEVPNDFFYVESPGKDVEFAVSASLKYLTDKIRTRQEFLEKLGLINGAFSPSESDLVKMLQFVKRKSSKLF
jgi:hypothetical protein